MSLLEVRKINCFYGYIQVLWDLNMYIDAQETVAVVGSNGAGKTTLLRALCGLHKISSGSVLWKGEEIGNSLPHHIVNFGISQICEGGGIFPHMTVSDNLKVGAYTKANWKNRTENKERVFSMFPILRERKDQLAGTLSGGERQMLGIGKGLMSSPELLIFDEPSLGLSPLLVAKVLKVIEEISKQGVTILFVEQNVYHAMEISGRSYVLENGRIIKEGHSKNLMEDDYVKKAYLGI